MKSPHSIVTSNELLPPVYLVCKMVPHLEYPDTPNSQVFFPVCYGRIDNDSFHAKLSLNEMIFNGKISQFKVLILNQKIFLTIARKYLSRLLTRLIGYDFFGKIDQFNVQKYGLVESFVALLEP